MAVPPKLRQRLLQIGRLADGCGVRAYAIGGCVRDLLLGRSSTEIDVAVEGDSVALARAVAEATAGTLTVHEQFGTASVALTAAGSAAHAYARIDFAMCRRETYGASGAYPQVTPGAFLDDLARRDFTINALALPLRADGVGELIDEYRGVRDLRVHRLRVLHARSFLDDPSRILRGIRFARRFGCTFEPSTKRWLLAALRDGALERLNRGRWRKELWLMLDEPDPLACFRQLGQLLAQSGRKGAG